MKYKIIGDESHYHSGCVAVMQTLRTTLAEMEDFTEVEEDFDALIVNGEGTMHHDTRGFARKMEALRAAQATGKKTYLINSLWQQNGSEFDDVLSKLDGLSVRGLVSARDLYTRHAMQPAVALDLSYYAPVDASERSVDFAGATITTDLYSHEFKQFVWLSGAPVKNFPVLDLRKTSWSDAVNQIATASVIVAGRHHAMYAACRARKPFVAFDGNSHKFADLLEWADSRIPICTRMADIPLALAWARSNISEYERLFDWMDQQPRWRGLDQSDAGYIYTGLDDPNTHKHRAAAAETIFHWKDAAAHWSLVRAIKDTAGNLERHSTALARSGAKFESALLMAKGRWKYPALCMEDTTIFQTIGGSREELRDGFPIWFSHFQDARTALARGSIETFRKSAESFLLESGPDYALAHTSLVSLLISAQNFELAGEMVARPDKRPADLRFCEQFRLGLAQGLGSADMLTLLDGVKKSKAWKGPDVRAAAYRYLWLVNGPSAEILSELESDPASNSNSTIFRIATGVAAELNEPEHIGAILTNANRATWQKAITLPLAAYIREYSVKTSIKINAEIDTKAALFQMLTRNGTAFANYIGDRNARIAVVGNAPNEIGRGRGTEIDRHDIVVRFNIFDVSNAYENDYGSRIDVIITTERVLQDIRTEYAERAKYIVMSRNLALRSDAKLDTLLENDVHKDRYVYLPDQDRTYLYAQLGRGASAGLKFLYHLSRLRGGLENVSTYGFAFTEPNASGSAHYFETHTSSQRHNWPAEKRLFNQLLGK
jgi:hypothetical protein